MSNVSPSVGRSYFQISILSSSLVALCKMLKQRSNFFSFKQTNIVFKLSNSARNSITIFWAPNFLNPKPKHFQTERTRRLACLPSFCELVKWKAINICHFFMAFHSKSATEVSVVVPEMVSPGGLETEIIMSAISGMIR